MVIQYVHIPNDSKIDGMSINLPTPTIARRSQICPKLANYTIWQHCRNRACKIWYPLLATFWRKKDEAQKWSKIQALKKWFREYTHVWVVLHEYTTVYVHTYVYSTMTTLNRQLILILYLAIFLSHLRPETHILKAYEANVCMYVCMYVCIRPCHRVGMH
jgi:hypothetical protein